MKTASHPEIALLQGSLPGFCAITEAVRNLSCASDESERGAIFTKREVVDFMLDLAGYTPDKDLTKLAILEPSSGGGEFLLAVVERLIASRNRVARGGDKADSLARCIKAVELHRDTYEKTRETVIATLGAAGFSGREATSLADAWLVHGDFLLVQIPGTFDFVVGNPPYVRQELIPAPLLAEYRRRYSTLYDRADLYIPFIERSLRLLGSGGRLCFICADRWMKNKYGGPLRQLVAKDYHLAAYVDMVGTDAFHADVAAYPAITLISKERAGPTRVAKQPKMEPAALKSLAAALRGEATLPGEVKELGSVAVGSAPWVLAATDQTTLVRRIESAFPLLEETGCRVGIGVATGADKAFIGKFDELDVEPDRKLPIAMTRDITTGHIDWRGYGVINPFTDEGPLVELDRYPRLKRYLEDRREQLLRRHVARKAPANWYRTIDRITPSLAAQPKLLIPDIKGKAQVVYEDGKLYPHHNLYFVVSESWDLRALQAVLLSGLTRLFIETYSTRMRGGFLRFQAQYLRKIRLPRWESVPEDIRARLLAAAKALDIDQCDQAVSDLYGLTRRERKTLFTQS